MQGAGICYIFRTQPPPPPDLFVLFGQVAPRGWGTKYWLLLDKHRAA